MRKLLIGITVTTILFCLFLIYNHKQLPTKDDVYKITGNWSPKTKEVYLVKKIDDDWLTIFRNKQFILVGRLEQNWLGFWQLQDDIGREGSLVSVYYPPSRQDEEFTWSGAGTEEGAYYFGQIINPDIKKIQVVTKKNSFENALIMSAEGTRFFFIKSEEELVMPVNIKGFSKNGKLIYSSFKQVN
ncbi:hypothetical protein [Desertibacillus haloalkaliphilus]|uniref:hypothetical protein n=1 Tax=Desertibacillus haloalkaliphilus TaxID=1328930 RepID=UPI001C25EC59|nr:hypothetical protein [Desertibacillus haloalkaliphilus]MBU8906268.1 hypothetical protein [Desertibacillus haloalkaliphilus]